jgi:hypothetical protein
MIVSANGDEADEETVTVIVGDVYDDACMHLVEVVRW